jgi:hypothetical protein
MRKGYIDRAGDDSTARGSRVLPGELRGVEWLSEFFRRLRGGLAGDCFVGGS